jgi:hypothetical protein
VSVSWQIANGLVLLESDASESFEEWRAAIEEAVASRDYRPGMGLVHDLRRSTRIPPTGEVEARAYHAAGQMRAHAIRRWALVVTSDAAFGIVRLAEMLAEKAVDIRAFRDPEDAEAWARGGIG